MYTELKRCGYGTVFASLGAGNAKASTTNMSVLLRFSVTRILARKSRMLSANLAATL